MEQMILFRFGVYGDSKNFGELWQNMFDIFTLTIDYVAKKRYELK